MPLTAAVVLVVFDEFDNVGKTVPLIDVIQLRLVPLDVIVPQAVAMTAHVFAELAEPKQEKKSGGDGKT